jgi:hypothetical protein
MAGRCAGKAGRQVSAMRAHLNPRRDLPPRPEELGDCAAPDRHAAGDVLGVAHPLVGVLARLETVGQQLLAVAAAHVLALASWWTGLIAGLPLVTSSMVVLIVLGCRRLLLVQRRRELCLELIVAGRARLPLAAVARERRRLSSPHYRACLARTLDELAEEGERGRQPRTAQPCLDLTAIRSASPQLHELARLLRRDSVSSCGVALTEQLLSSPESPLYGSEPELLRQELGRARFLLRQSGELARRS